MQEQLKQNFEMVRQRIAEAAIRSGRTGADVTLVGVTKYVDVDVTRMLCEAGCIELGESRPQLLAEKAAALSDWPIDWHMIGHLQRNKVKKTVAICDLIHSVDSERLLTAIDNAGNAQGKVVNVLLEVNVSQESAKLGFSLGEIGSAIEFVSNLKHVRVKGLMCMAGLSGGDDDARREFAILRELAEKNSSDLPSNVQLTELSMGMSGDFEIAIEEGATLVRVGSLLFEKT